MPITAWVCPNCGDAEVPLDHFERSETCGEVVHPDYAAAVLWAERTHYRAGKREIGVTDVLGCPRKAAMRADLDYAMNPLDGNAPLGGTAWHALMLTAAGRNNADIEVRVEGEVDGAHVVGQIDRLRGDLVEDWKCTNDFDARRRPQEGAKPDHKAQVSFYAELADQSGLRRPIRGIIWYRYQTKAGLIPAKVYPLMGVAELLAYKPTAGESTVRDHLGWLARWQSGEATWQQIPLYGEMQSFGDKDACAYCPLRGPCRAAARGAEF